jgi:hypothetical protein
MLDYFIIQVSRTAMTRDFHDLVACICMLRATVIRDCCVTLARTHAELSRTERGIVTYINHHKSQEAIPRRRCRRQLQQSSGFPPQKSIFAPKILASCKFLVGKFNSCTIWCISTRDIPVSDAWYAKKHWKKENFSWSKHLSVRLEIKSFCVW